MNQRSFAITFGLVVPVLAAFVVVNIDKVNTKSLLGLIGSDTEEVVTEKPKTRLDSLDLSRPASEFRASSPVLTARNTVLYYDQDSGRIIELSLSNGLETTFTENILPDFIESIWGRAQKDVISLFSVNGFIEPRYYNFSTRVSSKLSSDISNIAFSPDGSKIVYFKRGDSPGVFISNPDGSSSKMLLATRIPQLDIFWPSPENIYLITQDSGSGQFLLSRLSLDGGLKIVKKDSLIKDPVFSIDGEYLAYSNDRSSYILKINGLDLVELGPDVETGTCSWGNDELVCKSVIGGRQVISRISPETGTQNILTDVPDSIRVELVVESLDGNVLAIKDSYSGKIFLTKIN